MKKFSLALLALATALAIAPLASATPITGTLNVNNGLVFTSVSPTGITFNSPAEISASTGSFSTMGGDQVDMVASLPSTSTALTLFTGASGDALTDALSYDVTSYSYSDVAGSVTVLGVGTMWLNGSSATYDFTLTAQGDSQGSFSLTAVTPEPSSLLLLGTGLLGLAFFAFRKAKSSGPVLSI